MFIYYRVCQTLVNLVCFTDLKHLTTSILSTNYTTTNCIYSTVQFSTISLPFYLYCGISMLNEPCITIGRYSSPPITGTVTQVFPVKIVPEHLPLLFSGCKYGTKR